MSDRYSSTKTEFGHVLCNTRLHRGAVDASELQPGDSAFFNTLRPAFSHVGIYLGDNLFIHSTRTGKSVQISQMNDSYWSKRNEGARRMISGAE
jgi:cell wall-associated NlpC family hydrolase